MQKYLLIFLLLPLFAENVNARTLFEHQWISGAIGRTNHAFKENSGNDHGVGIFYNAGFSSSIYEKIFISYSSSKVKEYQAPMYDVYKPIEYFNQKSIMFGRYFIANDFCILPSLGYCWMDGTNRGEWLGEPGIESYACEDLPYDSNGLCWALQFNTNANGWLGVGLQFTGVTNSKKDYWGASLLLKIGRQYKE